MSIVILSRSVCGMCAVCGDDGVPDRKWDWVRARHKGTKEDLNRGPEVSSRSRTRDNLGVMCSCCGFPERKPTSFLLFSQFISIACMNMG